MSYLGQPEPVLQPESVVKSKSCSKKTVNFLNKFRDPKNIPKSAPWDTSQPLIMADTMAHRQF